MSHHLRAATAPSPLIFVCTSHGRAVGPSPAALTSHLSAFDKATLPVPQGGARQADAREQLCRSFRTSGLYF
jgi:hypothetical protein